MRAISTFIWNLSDLLRISLGPFDALLIGAMLDVLPWRVRVLARAMRKV